MNFQKYETLKNCEKFLAGFRLHVWFIHDPVVGVAFIVVDIISAIIRGIMEIFKAFVSHS